MAPPKRISPKKAPVKQSLNDFMHPRNFYFNNAPDFSCLAQDFEDFRKISSVALNGKVSVDFSQPDTMRTLTRCLLKSDFDLDVHLPPGYLAPAVPQRLNYLLWCEDIVTLALGKTLAVRAVDFGTGSSCILPLLGARQCSWTFSAVEANPGAFEFAVENVAQNGLADRIAVVKTTEGEIRFEEFLEGDDVYDILLCNPPFYKDSWEADAATRAEEQGRSAPPGDCDGTQDEKVTSGGEIEFVKRIFEQGLAHKPRIRVLTAMLGKKKDLKELTRYFQENDVRFTTTEFCQGRTMRWGVAWTHLDEVNLSVVPQMKHVAHKPPLVLDLPKFIPGVKYTTETVCTRVKELLANVQIKFTSITEGKHNCHLWVLAEHNTLAGQRRRRRQRQQKDCAAVPTKPQDLVDEVARVKAQCSSSAGTSADTPPVEGFHGSKRSRSSEEFEDEEDLEEDSPSAKSASPMDCKSPDSESVPPPTKRSFFRDDVSQYFLNCDLRVRRTASGLIIQLQNRDPRQGRDPLCQLQQYLKNNLCSQPKDLALTLKMVV